MKKTSEFKISHNYLIISPTLEGKIFVGENVRHPATISSLFPDEVFPFKVIFSDILNNFPVNLCLTPTLIENANFGHKNFGPNLICPKLWLDS